MKSNVSNESNRKGWKTIILGMSLVLLLATGCTSFVYPLPLPKRLS
jgi:hypothetical protein